MEVDQGSLEMHYITCVCVCYWSTDEASAGRENPDVTRSPQRSVDALAAERKDTVLHSVQDCKGLRAGKSRSFYILSQSRIINPT